MARRQLIFISNKICLSLAIFFYSCQDNYVVDRSSLCNCSNDVDNACFSGTQNWNFTVNNLLEVSALDFAFIAADASLPTCETDALTSGCRNQFLS